MAHLATPSSPGGVTETAEGLWMSGGGLGTAGGTGWETLAAQKLKGQSVQGQRARRRFDSRRCRNRSDPLLPPLSTTYIFGRYRHKKEEMKCSERAKQISGASGPPMGSLCCCSVQCANLVLSFFEIALFSAGGLSVISQSGHIAVAIPQAARIAYFLVTAIMGLLVAFASMCCSQGAFKSLIRVQFPMQQIAFWLEVVPDLFIYPLLMIYFFFDGQSSAPVLVAAAVVIGVLMAYLHCKLSYNLLLIAEVGGTGWETMSAKEIVEARTDGPTAVIVGSESDPLLPPAANTSLDGTQPTLTVQI